MKPAIVLVAGHEARASARLLLLLSLGIMLVGYVVTSEYPDFRARMLSQGKHIPAFLRKLVEARAGGLTFETLAPIAYVHPVALALMASWPIARASRAIAGDLERGALGWHLSYPIGRTAFLWGKASVLLVGVAVMQMALFGAFRLSLWYFGLVNAGPWPYANAGLMGALLYGAVGTLTLWVSAASGRAAVPGMVGASIVLGSVLLENVGGLYPLFERFRWLSLYHYYNYSKLIGGTPLAALDVGVLSAVLVVGLVGATWSFARRDLPI
jgi:hypothetical protein